MTLHQIILAYVGPETVVPMASAIATLVGFWLMVGRRIKTWAAAALVSPVGRWRAGRADKPTVAGSVRQSDSDSERGVLTVLPLPAPESEIVRSATSKVVGQE